MSEMQNHLRKLFFLFCLLGLVAVAANAQEKLEVGELTLVGSACENEAVKAQIDQGFLQIPATTTVRKITAESLTGGTCSFSLPLHVPKNQKLVISQLSAPGYADLGQGTRGKMVLEVFKAGDRGEQLIFEEKAEAGRLRKAILFEKEAKVFESECGEGFSLRGKTSILMVDGIRRSKMGLDLLQLKVELIRCDGLRPL